MTCVAASCTQCARVNWFYGPSARGTVRLPWTLFQYTNDHLRYRKYKEFEAYFYPVSYCLVLYETINCSCDISCEKNPRLKAQSMRLRIIDKRQVPWNFTPVSTNASPFGLHGISQLTAPDCMLSWFNQGEKKNQQVWIGVLGQIPMGTVIDNRHCCFSASVDRSYHLLSLSSFALVSPWECQG